MSRLRQLFKLNSRLFKTIFCQGNTPNCFAKSPNRIIFKAKYSRLCSRFSSIPYESKKSITVFQLIVCLASLTIAELSSANNSAATPEKQSMQAIHQLVLNHIKQKADQNIFEPEFKIRELSSRLNLKKCQSPLTIDDRNPTKGVGRMTIGVSCEQPKWRIYVPAEIKGKLPIIYSSRAILRGKMIDEQDIRRELISHNRVPPGAIVKKESVIGMRAKRPISANSVIKVHSLQPPYWVYKNQSVNIITRIGSIEVRSQGVSQKSAVEGEQVPVRNSKTEKLIKGIVIAPNTVLVP